MHRRIILLILVVFVTAWLPDFKGTETQAQSPDHPRLWLTPDTVIQLRGWAHEDNLLWGMLVELTDEAIADMDAGALPASDEGTRAWVEYPNENYAMLFAFMSLIHPDETRRVDYADRARTLLMYVIEQAAAGPAADEPFRDPDFAISDRSRWFGEGFPLTVDWIYPTLSAEDKALIRTVFLRWCEENRYATTTNFNHPKPVGVVNDPVLLADREAVRWSTNNYYTAHMRNMGLMALALDPADDPDGRLRAYLTEATGAWLYVIDEMMRTDIAGGLGAEGFEYSPQSMGYVAQFLLALHTAGVDDPALYGSQVTFANPFWDDAIRAYLNSLSPQTVEHDYLGQVYQPAWYGSGQQFYMPDHIAIFGSLGVYDYLTGNTQRLNTLRWVQRFTGPGGEPEITERMDFEQFDRAILYFMLFDPAAPVPADPRPDLPTTHYARGMRRFLARTDWSPDATWFAYGNSWQTSDHQSGNANSFEFYRQGEWLTKVRVGYDLDFLTSENLNTLSIENLPPDRDPTDYRWMIYERGSQWLYTATGAPEPPVITMGDGYISIYGDATNVYNSEYEEVMNVTLAARSIVWLMPDVLVIYDQAITQHDGFKRFSLNLPRPATTAGNMTTMITPNGQQFVINTLLPADAVLSMTEIADEPSGPPAHGEIVSHRFVAEVPSEVTTVHFLHVLIGADSGAALPAITLLSDDPTAPVVQVGDRMIRFSSTTITVEGEG